ncbi:hypothetical protein [Streptomyces iconiensis]|uniref:Uncharacterized protein n=1 Tax=Streptomyces iconiensis TaxID=1384038 RepID=A0ABT7A4B2_9ACTN|nr:hypothetical protein [Streptomyces iconiensis]MDJ1136189.1 hypothetical protein [Streptomyces iconiensis]
MRARRAAVGSLVVTAAMGVGALAGAGPVQAAPGTSVAPATSVASMKSVQAGAPSAAARMCVKTHAENKAHGYLVRVTNKCGRTVKVKIIMRLAKDSRCFTLKKGQSRYRETQGIGTWKKTVFC